MEILAQHWSKAGLQYSVKLAIGNETHGATERALVGAAIIFLKCALVVFTALVKRDGRIEIQIGCAINICKIVVRQSHVFSHRRDARDTKVGLSAASACKLGAGPAPLLVNDLVPCRPLDVIPV